MFETKIKKKKLIWISYIIGCILEFIGFGMLFNLQKTIEILSNYWVLFGLFFIVGGYFIAVGARRIK